MAPPASAHANSTSYVRIDVTRADAPPVLRWDLSLHDLVWAVFIDRDFDGVVTLAEVRAAHTAIERSVLGEIVVSRGGQRCSLEAGDFALVRRAEQDHLSATLSASCPTTGQLEIGGSLFMTGDATQRVLLSVTRGTDLLTGSIGVDARSWTEPRRASAWQDFRRFVVEGMWHVLIGYDHIAFILLLLLPSVLLAVEGKWQGTTRLPQVTRDIVTIVTAFTVAHSLTLALAVTGTVTLPTQPIEVAIAASIAVAGILNLLPRFSRLRLPLAFGFGLVHGFGFANVLGEINASGVTLLPLLAGFNIGVELAQLAIVAIVLPIIYSLRATPWYARGLMPLGSCALAGAGLVWLVQRL